VWNEPRYTLKPSAGATLCAIVSPCVCICVLIVLSVCLPRVNPGGNAVSTVAVSLGGPSLIVLSVVDDLDSVNNKKGCSQIYQVKSHKII